MVVSASGGGFDPYADPLVVMGEEDRDRHLMDEAELASEVSVRSKVRAIRVSACATTSRRFLFAGVKCKVFLPPSSSGNSQRWWPEPTSPLSVLLT
jgi:hypothetical protein